MSFQESFDLLSFRSRQHAFHFSQVLKDYGIPNQIMSTPREIALGCGLSIRFSTYMTNKVLTIYKQYNSPVIGCYHIIRNSVETKIFRIPL